jgi:hypothetical protein
MKKLLALLSAVVLLAFLPVSAANAQVLTEDNLQACDWVVSTYGTNNGHYLINNATHRIRLDYSHQVRRDSNDVCQDQFRGKMNIYCYEGLSLSDCTVSGTVYNFRNGSAFSGYSYPDWYTDTGVMTWYGGWQNMPGIGNYQAKTFFADATVDTTYYNVTDGFYGYSHECFYSGGPVGGSMSC